MAFVNGNKVTLPALGVSYNYNDAVKEIAALLGVSRRTSGEYAGKFVLADICTASSVNKWAEFKSFPLKDNEGNDIEDNAFSTERSLYNYYTSLRQTRTALLGYSIVTTDNFCEVAGIDLPIYYISSSLNNDAPYIMDMIDNFSSNGKNWEKTPWSRRGGLKRIRDFNGYNHNAECPFIYTIDEDIPVDATAAQAYLAHLDKSDSVSIIDMFKTALGDEFYAAAIFKRKSGSYEVVQSENKMSVGGAYLPIPSTMVVKNEEITCYYLAYNPSRGQVIPLPSTRTCANPMTTNVTQYAQADPLRLLSWPSITSSSFSDVCGYDSSTGASKMISLADTSIEVNRQTFKNAPSTTGSFIFSVTLTNPTSAAVTIRPNYFRVFVSSNNAQTSVMMSPTNVYNSSMASIMSQDISIAAGGSYQFFIYLSNIWSGSVGTTASDTTVQFLGLRLSYYNGHYEKSGSSYPDSYPNINSISVCVARPATSSNNNKVAKPASSYGFNIGSFVNY